MTSLELYLHCLPLERFRIPRDDVPKSEKSLWDSRNCSLHTKLQAALGAGRHGFPGNACLGYVPEFAVSSEELEKGIARASA